MKDNTVTSLRINRDILESIKIRAELENKSQSEFINTLLSDALTHYDVKKTGGAVFTTPNPQFYHIPEEIAKKAVDCCLKLAIELSKDNVYTSLGGMSDFLADRLLHDTDTDKEAYMNYASILKK